MFNHNQKIHCPHTQCHNTNILHSTTHYHTKTCNVIGEDECSSCYTINLSRVKKIKTSQHENKTIHYENIKAKL